MVGVWFLQKVHTKCICTLTHNPTIVIILMNELSVVPGSRLASVPCRKSATDSDFLFFGVLRAWNVIVLTCVVHCDMLCRNFELILWLCISRVLQSDGLLATTFH